METRLKHVQTTLDLETYKRLRNICTEKNLKVKDVLRNAIKAWIGEVYA